MHKHPSLFFRGLVERKKFYMLDTRSIRRRRISLCATSLTHPSVAYVKKLFPFVNVSPQNKLELYKFQGGKEPAGPQGKLKLFLSVWLFVGKFTMFKRLPKKDLPRTNTQYYFFQRRQR